MNIPSTPSDVYKYIENNIFNEYKEDVIKNLQQGQKVVDVGGGEGETSVLIAKRIGDKGMVVNIEGTLEQAKLAEQNAEIYGVSHIMKVYYQHVSKTHPIYYPTDYFDVAYANRVLCISKEYKDVLAEMYRVVKLGGEIVASCPDISTFSSSVLTLEEEYLMKKKLKDLWKDSYLFTKNFLKDFQEIGLKEKDMKFYTVIDRDFLGGTLLESMKEGDTSKYLPYNRLDNIISSQENNFYYSSISIFSISGLKSELISSNNNDIETDYQNDL